MWGGPAASGGDVCVRICGRRRRYITVLRNGLLMTGVKRKGYKAWLTQWAMAMAMARGVVSLKALSHRVIRR